MIGMALRTDDLTIPSGGITLGATLTHGDSGKLAFVMVHGSGPLDRDENMGRQKLSVFDTLAAALADAGHASLRFDKRGVGQSCGTFAEAGLSDYAYDALAAVAALRKAGYGKVGLLGHSEGTLVSCMAAQRAPLAALVLLCPFVTDGATLLRAQAARLAADIAARKGLSGVLLRGLGTIFGTPSQQQERLIARLRASTGPTIRVAWKRIPAMALRDFVTLDFEAQVRDLDLPILSIGCERDLQCPPGDAERLAHLAGARAEHVILPQMSHILRRTDERTGFFDYPRQMRQPIDPLVPQVILDWLADQTG